MGRSARLVVAALVAAVVFVTVAGAASAAAKPGQAPWWMTQEVRERIAAKGLEGASIREIRAWVRAGAAGQGRRDDADTVEDPCPGVEPYEEPRVNAGACQVAPHGCTENFVFHRGPLPFTEVSDGAHHFIGTAGHCVDHAGQPVFLQVFTGVIAKVGEVEKLLAGDIGRNGRGNGGIGNDFAIVRIDEGWKVEPRSPAGGPQGIYTGCEPRDVKFWGHGLGVAVGQGRVEGGFAGVWYDRSYGWAGSGLPGDSGSGVMIADTEEAAGNLTHLLFDERRYPGSNLAGTRLTRALTWMGHDYHLVNQDRSKSRATMADTDCGNADASPSR